MQDPKSASRNDPSSTRGQSPAGASGRVRRLPSSHSGQVPRLEARTPSPESSYKLVLAFPASRRPPSSDFARGGHAFAGASRPIGAAHAEAAPGVHAIRRWERAVWTRERARGARESSSFAV